MPLLSSDDESQARCFEDTIGNCRADSPLAFLPFLIMRDLYREMSAQTLGLSETGTEIWHGNHRHYRTESGRRQLSADTALAMIEETSLVAQAPQGFGADSGHLSQQGSTWIRHQGPIGWALTVTGGTPGKTWHLPEP